MSLDDLWHDEEPEPRPGTRRRMAARAFVLSVLATGVLVVLAALLLWGLGVGGAALWNAWWDDFA